MPSVHKIIVSLFSTAQAKLPSSSGTQHSNRGTTHDVPMLRHVRERIRPSTVPILDPNGTPIWLTRLIGQGGQARVFVGERQGKFYAVKSFHRQQVIDEGNAKHVRRELGILSFLTERFPHPFIVELEWAFGYDRNLFLVMDWCPEDLHSRLTSCRLCRIEAKLYAAQLLAAIHHLHSHCIMHRDIKPSNILIDHQGNIKLTDFGFAIQFESSVPKEMHQTHSRVGTRCYKAPELLSDIRGPISYPADIYAFGVVFSQILFATIKKKATYYAPDQILQGCFPHVLQVFLTELTHPDPLTRPNAAMAMNNVWFSSIDWRIIMRCGYQNPYRPTYQRILSLNIDLEPIPREPKRFKRTADTMQPDDLLRGFNYVAPQHSDPGIAEGASVTSFSEPSPAVTAIPSPADDPDGSRGTREDVPAVSLLSSGKTAFSGMSPSAMGVALIDDKEDKSVGSTPKKHVWNWTWVKDRDKRKLLSIT